MCGEPWLPMSWWDRALKIKKKTLNKDRKQKKIMRKYENVIKFILCLIQQMILKRENGQLWKLINWQKKKKSVDEQMAYYVLYQLSTD